MSVLEVDETTTVVIVGCGIAGLTVGNLLLRNGVRCIILEKRNREHVEQRQRAGIIDARGVRMYREWGFEGLVSGTPVPSTMHFRIDGEPHPIELVGEDISAGRFWPQQALIRDLMEIFLRGGGDLRFGVREVSMDDVEGEHPRVRYRDSVGSTRVVGCEFIAGCDGDRGVSKTVIPADSLHRDAHEYGYAWLTIQADVPARRPGMLAIHSRGLAAQYTRGANASRFYLQCPVGDTTAQWPDERIWSELEIRCGEPVVTNCPITIHKEVVPLRSVVYSPMSYGRLYLLGDAAHIVPPVSAKGLNLALHDAEAFARAVIHQVQKGDPSLLGDYSSTCLRHIWNYQAYAAWITEVMHNAGDASYEGDFLKRIARAELERLSHSPTANRLFSEFLAGVN